MSDVELDDAALEAEAARLDAKRESAIKAQRLAITRLRLQGESLGEEGRDWAVVATGEGPVLVKRVSAVVSKVWREKVNSDKALVPADAYAFTASGVVSPDEATYKAWYIANESVPVAVANALTGIYLAAEELRKKGP